MPSGEVYFQTVGESPLATQMPQSMKDAILHASLIHQNLKILGSDMVSKNGLKKGNSASMMLNCDNEIQIENLYEILSQGGEKTHQLEHTFFGSLMGDLIDRYGNNWILNYQIEQKKKKKK